MEETILVYSSQTSSRLDYTLGIVFGKNGFKITSDLDEFLGYSGPKVNYSVQPADASITIVPDGLLFETGIASNQYILDDAFQCYRKGTEAAGDWGFDVLAAVFYFITRYEEYDPKVLDHHERYCGTDSLAYRYQMHTVALVDQWKYSVWEKLQERYHHIMVPTKAFQKMVTVDIDRLYLYKEKSWIKTCFGFAKDIIKGNTRAVSMRWKVLSGRVSDPHENIEHILASYQKKGIPIHIFWLLGNGKGLDNNISFHHRGQIETIEKYSRFANLGIHPSYHGEPWTEEKENLERIINKRISASRQHFLRLRFPHTYQMLLQLGIVQDYTMGWHDIVGFRAGTSFPFPWYDLSNETETELYIYPFVAMDVTLKNYMRLSPSTAKDILLNLENEVKKYGGNYMIVTHNESLSGWGEWEGWKDVLL